MLITAIGVKYMNDQKLMTGKVKNANSSKKRWKNITTVLKKVSKKRDVKIEKIKRDSTVQRQPLEVFFEERRSKRLEKKNKLNQSLAKVYSNSYFQRLVKLTKRSFHRILPSGLIWP